MKYLLIICSLFVATGAMFGQSEAALKDAKKKLKKYYLDSSGNADALTEAIALIETAAADESLSSDPTLWLTKGKIYNEVANAEFKKKTLDPSFQIVSPDAAVKASMSLKKVIEMAEKKGVRKDALNSLAETESFLNNSGIFAYQSEDYGNAFLNFRESVELASFLNGNNASSRLNEGTLLDEQLLFTAVSGFYSGDKAAVKPYFLQLFEKGSDEAFVYEGLYFIGTEEGDENAYTYLEEGRKKFPNDSGLLFSEINHFLAAGKLNVLTDKLKQAIAAEPDNISVYATLGNVYDQLAQTSRKDGKAEDAKGYFDEALNYYNQAIAKDANNFESNYGIGQMHYNKAADMVDELNKLGEDFTPAGIKKYDGKKAEMDALFEQALPYFKKAEAANEADTNTMIALKEIYARLNNVEEAEKYKAKYDKAASGQ